MKRRYEVVAVFTDSDFGGIPTSEKKFWFKTSAMNYWWNKEQVRRVTENGLLWRWVAYDLRTGENITPQL